MRTKSSAACGIDMEKYRLRSFVEQLIDMGEVQIHDQPVPLARPRERATAAFAQLEERVLQRVMKTRANDEAVSSGNTTHSVHARDIRWAV